MNGMVVVADVRCDVQPAIFSVTLDGKTQEFEEAASFRETLEVVRSYFRVRGGGLLLHGRGPVVSSVSRGECYELVNGTPMARMVMLANWLAASADVVRNGAAIKVSSSKRGAHGRAVAQRRLRSNQRRVAHDSSESSGSASDDEASTFGEDERSGRARRSTRGSDDDGDSESDEAFIDDEDDADRFDDTEHGDSDGELEVVGVFSGTKQLSAHEQLDALQPVVIHWRFVVLVLAMLVALAVPSAWHLLEFDSVAEFEARHTIHELEAPFLFVCAACGLFSLLLVAHDSGAHSVTWAKIKLE